MLSEAENQDSGSRERVGERFERPDPKRLKTLLARSATVKAGDVFVGRYAIEREILGGGMGCVFVARDLKMNDRQVVIKTFKAQDGAELDDAWRDRFKREVTISQSLHRHPSIVPVYGYGERGEDALPYMVMAFVDHALDLSAYVAERGGKLSEAEVVRLLTPIAEAIDFAHRPDFDHAAVVHRDIKPSNILIQTVPDGTRSWILDFGISKLTTPPASSVKVTLTDSAGTPGYVPPEWLRGDRTPRPANDVFSFAVVLYECLTGRHPFIEPGEDIPTQVVMYERIGRGTFPRLGCSPDLAKRIEAGLSSNPADRPQSCLAFFGDAASPSAGRSRRSPKKVWTVGVVTCAVLAVAAIGVFFRLRHEPPAVESDIPPPCPHHHQYGAWSNVCVATCVESGVCERVCIAAGCANPPTVERSVTSPKGHAWGPWTDDTPPKIGVPGKKRRTCSRCAADDWVTVPALAPPPHEHRYGRWETNAPTCETSGRRARSCEAPGCSTPPATETEELAALGHDWSEWSVTIHPKPGVGGRQQCVCHHCGKLRILPIDPLPVPEPTLSLPAPGEIPKPSAAPDARQMLRDAVSFSEMAREKEKRSRAERHEWWRKCLDSANAVLEIEPGNGRARRLRDQAENGLQTTADHQDVATPQNTLRGTRNANGVEWFN